MMRRKRERSGFTLVEIMIALSLLGIGLLSLAVMQVTAMQYASRGRHMTRAAAIAEEKMEELSRKTWAGIAPTAWTAAETVNELIQGPTDTIEQAYQRSWRITDVDAGRTRSIDVLVTWTEPNRPQRSYAITTLRFNYEGS